MSTSPQPQHRDAGLLVAAAGDFDRARAIGERAFFPHRLAPTDSPRRAVDMHLCACKIGPDVTVGRLGYGVAVRLDCDRLETGYQINIPLSGHIESHCGNQQLIASPTIAAVYTPDPRSGIDRWSADCVQI